MEDKDFQELERSIKRVMQMGTSVWKQHVHQDLSRTEVVLLYKLAKEGPQRASKLAKSLYITTGGLTGITDKLVNKGYIYRNRDDEDRRAVYLTISEKGEKVIHQMLSARKAFIDTVFDGISNDEKKHLLIVIKKMQSNLEHAKEKRKH